jgi:halocyanin-like protein
MVKLTGAVAAGTALAGCSGGDDPDDGGGGENSLDAWFENTDNYDGVVDETGSSSVTVQVGTGTDGFQFDPPAISVDAGTTVTWEWTGEGSAHNVVAEDGGFESELTDEEGFTFEQTFDDSGEVRYYCNPHKTMGMKGVVVVE